MLELLNMPFNMVHEMYRITFLTEQAQIEEQKRKEREEEEEREKQLQEERERKRHAVPSLFAANKMRETPSPKKPTEQSVPPMSMDDLEDLMEEAMP